MKKILFLMIFIFFIFYFYPCEKDERERIKHKIVSKYIKEQKKKRNLSVCSTGSGSGKCKGKFDMIHVGFRIQEELTIESARNLIVQLTNDLLNVINANVEFQDFIYPCPLISEGIQISLRILDSLGNIKYYPDGFHNQKISYAYLYNDKLNYCIDRCLEKPLENVGNETFEEAVAILEKKVNNLNK